jgi:oxygen-dependent protoporphyrinogen oxidase
MSRQVDKDLRQMLLRDDAPAPIKIAVRVWPKAIPQFNLGHLESVEVRTSLPPSLTGRREDIDRE